MSKPETMPAEDTGEAEEAWRRQNPKVAVIADLNVDPPESDGEGCPVPDCFTRSGNDEIGQVKSVLAAKDSEVTEVEDADQQCHGVSTSREEKVSNLKAGLVHLARKMSKNAHSHFLLGLMYQRLGQPQKAVSAFEKSSEILLHNEEESHRPELLSLVQIHHAQCILQANTCDNSNKELELDELEDIISQLKESVQVDSRQSAVWNILGLMLLKSGRIQSAISVLSSILALVPDCLDCIANLGIAHLQSGNWELSQKCFQDLILKDQNHPAAFINYATFLLIKYGSVVAGAGANVAEEAAQNQAEVAHIAKECMLAAARSDSRSGPVWVNLANAYTISGEHQRAKKCLEQAAMLDPHHMSTRYAVALHRIKDAERTQDPKDQLPWAANEMASVIREGDPVVIDLPIAWAGVAMAHRAQHEISAAYATAKKTLDETKERSQCSLKQAIEENPDDGVQWNQLGLHNLFTLQFEESQKFLKAAVARHKKCSYLWSNLGISLQLSNDPQSAEKVFKQALSLATCQEAHAVLSNLGILYRQQKMFEHAKKIFKKSLELCPRYAPAHNNLGLVYVAEGLWEEARSCFEKAVEMDSMLDAAKSNMTKAATMCRLPS